MLLSKSRYMVGLKCPRYLWMLFHDADKIPEHDLATKFLFKQGHLVGSLAKKWFPEGIDIQEDDFNANIKQTKLLLEKRVTLFEAGIAAGNIYSRADILNPVGDNEWDLIEVKSSSKVKLEHIQDVAFQKHVYEAYGLNIRQCYLMHVNKEFVKQGPIDSKDVLMMEDITKPVGEEILGISKRIKDMFGIIGSSKRPQTHVGAGCLNGMKCKCPDCWNFLPEGHVFELYRGGRTSKELFKSKVIEIKDIPEGYPLKERQEIQREVALSQKPHINKEGIIEFLDRINEPTYYLDFETFSTAIPIFDGTKPYEPIPFQYSLHIVKDGCTTHHSFLYDGDRDPREEFAQELKKVLPNDGTIIAYNQSFEKKVLSSLAYLFPEYQGWVDSVLPNFVDLLMPFRNFHYYSQKQHGSASIKNVLPAITGKSYKELDIADGATAGVSFYEVMYNSVTLDHKLKVRTDLIKYNTLDTEGMIWIIDGLRKAVEE